MRHRWPYSRRYRAIRARIRLSIGYIRHKLGETTDRDLRRTLASAQQTMIDLGLLRDAVDMLGEAAEVCAGMRFEELAADTIRAMIDALPSSLPRHVATAVRTLRKSLEAVDRAAVTRAAEQLRATLTLRSSSAV
ncbi:MAG: hypothetical protein GY856_11240 [bacterium]|nr:hypothetical protein [bacterium]